MTIENIAIHSLHSNIFKHDSYVVCTAKRTNKPHSNDEIITAQNFLIFVDNSRNVISYSREIEYPCLVHGSDFPLVIDEKFMLQEALNQAKLDYNIMEFDIINEFFEKGICVTPNTQVTDLELQDLVKIYIRNTAVAKAIAMIQDKSNYRPLRDYIYDNVLVFHHLVISDRTEYK